MKVLRKKESYVKVSYNKLWYLMLDKTMNKTNPKKVNGINITITKFAKGKNVTTDILIRIYKILDF
ncbi:MAG TPA: Cro/Cl family transcriptional regulator [Clostridia bacterium]|nr:Cro/Cl family transcriptional regulator [Clostridia bacterium]